ncbi:MAG: hypothetical protein A4S09_04025 [Proteobacteria bacterium SG_bin7]|nr:MAG: hypothetical protein A4S09_04025 [Proteobacteria bacterium SG_bin7]
MDEILVEFKDESKRLVNEMAEILEEVDGQFSHKFLLENYGQLVDRIMGGAKNMATMGLAKGPGVEKIGKYAELCKLVSYKSSQVDNEQLFTISVALLLDATEMLQEMINQFGTPQEVDVKSLLNATFLERLTWIATKFDEKLRASVAVNKEPSRKSQDQIDMLLRQLGVLSK